MARYPHLFTAQRAESDKAVREAHSLSHEFQTGPPCFPDFSERSLGRAGSNPSSSDLDNGLCLKGCMYTSNPLYHLAEMFSMQLITYRECAAARAGSPSRRNLDSIPAREEILVCSPAPCRRAPGPWAARCLWAEETGLQSQWHSSEMCGPPVQTAPGCQVSSLPQSAEQAGCSHHSPHW